ncbi:baseplate J/gp47 family protein [Pseudomonas japonica]|uniref:baseplate J/gp47 family protein n=1 Tax=Pseudomonas japonica TaxID=256466 RepID=UPI0015E360FC|nr:baseplate J/gp47 family protein [Pseudomonas japonica]MBA1289176.1 baseplate assembly protein [Pseudomonas japonica]
MSTFTPIDLAQLPDPSVVEQLDYEQLLAERKAHAISLWPEAERETVTATLALESEPLTKLLQESAYREMLLRQRVNEASLACLLAKARGADLEQLAANVNVKRLIVSPGNAKAIPPEPPVFEQDDSLRERAQMAWEGLSTAGPRNSYILHARSADGRIADASADSPSPATVVVTVQSLLGNGTVPPELLLIVGNYLSDEDRRPVGDRLTVQSAKVLPYNVSAILYLSSAGPETEPARAAAEARLKQHVHQRRRLGVPVVESALHAALHVEGVSRVELQNWEDVVPSSDQAPYCTAVNVQIGSAA